MTQAQGEEIERLEELAATYRRRLRVLERQRAQFGESHVPSRIVLEIEQTKADLKQTEDALEQLRSRPHEVSPSQHLVDIHQKPARNSRLTPGPVASWRIVAGGLGIILVLVVIYVFMVWRGLFVFPMTPVVLEGEGGTGAGEVMQRPNASEHRTVWLHAGEERTLQFELPANARYNLRVRYSNDNANGRPLEEVDVRIDGKSVGVFAPEDTGDGGYGWDIFKS